MLAFKNKYLFFLIAFMVVGCFAHQQQFTPKQKTIMFLGVYNSQFFDYMITMGYGLDEKREWQKIYEPELTEGQKIILREKKKVLEEMYPLIMIYDEVFSKGMIPDRELEEKILLLINRIQGV
jgi:hypothetical protein